MIHYKATIQHTASTIEKLCLTQYNSSQYWKKLLGGAVSLGMIVYGVSLGLSDLVSLMSVGLGCLLLANLNAPANYNRDIILSAYKGNYPYVNYTFYESGFSYEDNGEIIPYSNIYKIIDDNTYLYIYVSKVTSYMLVNSSVTGDNGLNGLKQFLTSKSGVPCSSPISLFNFRIMDLLPKKKKDI